MTDERHGRFGQPAADVMVPLFCELGELPLPGRQAPLPIGFGALALGDSLPEVRQRLLRDVKRRIERPAQVLLGQPDLLFAQRLAVRGCCVVFVWTAVGDVRAADDQRGPLPFRLRGAEGSEVVITPLPLYHIFSLTANCLVFMTLGAENVLIPNPRDIPGFVKEMARILGAPAP